MLDGVVKHLEEFGCDGIDGFALGQRYRVDFMWSLGLSIFHTFWF